MYTYADAAYRFPLTSYAVSESDGEVNVTVEQFTGQICIDITVNITVNTSESTAGMYVGDAFLCYALLSIV